MNKENPLLLHIETATEVCSVALSEGDRLLAVCESADGNSHSKNLLPFIDELCRKSGRALRDIDGVAVSVGPGSYTGLRIGVSTAKGIAYALQVPVMAVGTLESIAYGALAEGGGECPAAGLQIVPMIDARRMEVFTCRYNEKMEEVAPAEALIVDEEAFAGPLAPAGPLVLRQRDAQMQRVACAESECPFCRVCHLGAPFGAARSQALEGR